MRPGGDACRSDVWHPEEIEMEVDRGMVSLGVKSAVSLGNRLQHSGPGNIGVESYNLKTMIKKIEFYNSKSLLLSIGVAFLIFTKDI